MLQFFQCFLISGSGSRTFSTVRMSKSLKNAYIAIGSNVGDRATSILLGFEALKSLGSVKRTSHLYETFAKYYEDQPKFLNAVCHIQTSLNPYELLSSLQNIEGKLGRTKNFRNGPRNIDLDIIFYDEEVIETPELVIPHPRMHERDFVLYPLCDINDELIHPSLKISVGNLLRNLPSESTSSDSTIKKVIPLGDKLFSLSDRTYPIMMGILNVTPDRF